MDETSQPQNSGYGKKSVGQWVVIYVVIGAVVYGLVYYFFFAKKGGYSSNQTGQSPQPTTQQQVTTQPTAGSQTETPSTATVQKNTVTLTQDGFSPATLTVKAGETVTWVNKSGTDATVNSDPHPTHENYTPLNLGKLSDGGTLSLKFDKSGTYGYHNHFDASQKGTIVVQ